MKDLVNQRDNAQKDKKVLNQQSINKLILTVFSTYIVGIFGDYQKYLTYLEDQACFNLDLFLSNKNSKYNNFYSDIVLSQNFNNFIQNNPQNNSLFTKIALRKSGKRQTNITTEKKMSIMNLFAKKKLIEFNVNDLTSSNISSNANSDIGSSSKVINKDVSIVSENNSKTSNNVDQSSEIMEYIVPPFFFKSPFFDIEKIEECVGEYGKCKFMIIY